MRVFTRSDAAWLRENIFYAGIWFFGIELLLRFVSSLYFFNLATTGLNASAALSVVFFIPWFSPWLKERFHRTNPIFLAVPSFLFTITSLLWEPGALTGIVTSSIGLFFLYLLLLRARSTEESRNGIILGWALLGIYLAAGYGDRPSGFLNLLFVTLLGILWMISMIRPSTILSENTSAEDPAVPAWKQVGQSLLFTSWLFSQFVYFQFPGTIRAWTDLPFPFLAILFGATAFLALFPPTSRLLGTIPGPCFSIVAVFCSLDLIYLKRFTSASSFLLSMILLEALRRLPLCRNGKIFPGLSSTVFVISCFGWTFTYTYDQARLLGSEVFRDKAPVFLFLLTLGSCLSFNRGKKMSLPGRSLIPVAVFVVSLITAFFIRQVVLPEPVEGPIHVASYNIYQGFNIRGQDNRWKLLKFLQENELHLVGLQESDTTRPSSRNRNIVEFVARGAYYEPFFGPPPAMGSFGVSILSRFPVLERKIYPLPSSGQQAFVVATGHRYRNRDFYFLVTHFGHTDKDHLDQIRESIRIVHSLPGAKIFVGDFNMTFNTQPDAYLLKELLNRTGLTDAVQWIHPDFASPDQYTCCGSSPGARIDYIFVSPEFKVLRATVLRNVTASDHYPVTAQLEFRTDR